MLQQEERQNSIVDRARQHSAGNHKPANRHARVLHDRSGVYINEEAGGADGYVRRSPVQDIRVDPKYRTRLIKRGVLTGCLLVLVVAGLYALTQYLSAH